MQAYRSTIWNQADSFPVFSYFLLLSFVHFVRIGTVMYTKKPLHQEFILKFSAWACLICLLNEEVCIYLV